MSKISYESMMQALRIEKYREFEKYDKVVNLGINAMWKELCDNVSDPDIDPTELYDEEMETLRNIDYSMKLMNICSLSETWEQDLYNFLKEKGLVTVYSNDYRITKRVFERYFKLSTN